MKKNLIKITAAAFAATMTLTATGMAALADETAETPDTAAVSEGTPVDGEIPALIEEPATDAPADVEEPATDAPAVVEEPATDAPAEIPTEDVVVTTVTTEVAVISTETTVTADTQITTEHSDTLLTSGSWRSNKGDYEFDPSRTSGYFNGAHFTYEVLGSTVKFSLSNGTTLTGTLSIASADNFSITWSDGSVETFSRQNASASTTTAKASSSKSSSSTSTSKSSSSAPAGKTDSPKTGDDFHALPIAALAVTGAAVCFISFRKKEND
ncbi:MAG: hypothetical protein J6I55_08400 [Ruminococcus sp.]|nr:hypothetical protein [Ruminococcus sp.]